MRRGTTTYHPYERHYLRILTEALGEPDTKSMPTCHEHIEALAQSIHLQQLSDTVIVLVDPGIREPDIFGCFLCQKDGKRDERLSPCSCPARSGTIGGDPG
jgi:hypothetical protein